jgi:TonB-linked SusC/RagA family outer membrane protein
MRILASLTFMGLLCPSVYAAVDGAGAEILTISAKTYFYQTREDTARVKKDTTFKEIVVPNKPYSKINPDPQKLSIFPAISLQQYLKGEAAGLYVQESSGEPGVIQNMFIHGTSQPLLSARELFATQPLVILDGVPLVAEHPYSFDIQQNKLDRIGPATNTLANINMSNIQSIEVLKGLSAVAAYGPKAANGAIVLKTNAPSKVRKITFDSYVGVAQKEQVTTINGKFENAFRKQFYDKYTANGSYFENDVYPLYLSDSLNNSYYGPSNWTDNYYSNAMVYGANASIGGGNERANFRFSLGTLRTGGIADNTGADRYDTRFVINMKPLKWLSFSAMFNGNQVLRQRNKNVRDRLSQVNYLPDLSVPLAPNNERYGEYLNLFEDGFDDNKMNVLESYVKVGAKFGKFNFITSMGLDYNEGYRDIFFGRKLLQTTNYASNYYGYNQRASIDNILTYDYAANEDHKFNFLVGNSIQYDAYRYSYAYAYKGSNDYIKLNLLADVKSSDPLSLTTTVFRKEMVYKFLDRTRNNQLSFYGKADYVFKQHYTFSALLRADASSNQQPTNRWFYSPILTAKWNFKSEFFEDQPLFSEFFMRAALGRTGRYEHFDNYAQGPQYTASIGFTGNLITPGYNGLAVLNRPYQMGSVGYGLEWAYTDQLNIGWEASLFKGRLNASLDLYLKEDKNMLLGIPGAAEYGYTKVIRNGMNVRNSGVDLSVNGVIVPAARRISWNAGLNLNFNNNKLTALPGGLDELVIGDKLLKVGSAVDSYWLLTNTGIYGADAEVPMNTDGRKLNYNGIDLKAGDPRWVDLNNDGTINEEDRTLQGHALPVVSGGFNHDFGYKKWSASFNFYFNLGRDLMNQEMANRFDFINREGLNDIASVREITYWEKRGDYSNYPIYNPWSSVIPYQVNQDLFLENASFLKLRTFSLAYDLTSVMKKKSSNVQKVIVYGSVHNVFTLTPYSGRDPELVNYTGYDTGYGIQIPRTFTLGIKMSL